MNPGREFPRALGALGLAVFALLVLPHCAGAQVFEVVGGNSSLYQAGGGSFLVHGPGYDTSIGAGIIGGHFTYGGYMQKQIGNYTLTAGDNELDMLFPTDVFSASHYLYARGAGIKMKLEGLDMATFAGTTSSLYDTPIFQGADAGDPMGFVSLHKTISPRWQLWSESLYSGKLTQLVAAQWTPRRKFQLAATGGIGAGDPYAAVSINLSRKYFDVLGSYISAGAGFRRVVVSSPVQAEPDKANLLVSIRPLRRLTVSGGTQSYQVPDPVDHINIASSVRNASAALQIGGALVSGVFYDSSAFGETTQAGAITGTRDITRRLKVMSSYMLTKAQAEASTGSSFTTFTEMLNQHISVNENIGRSNGQTSIHYGGSLLTNLIEFSASYETFYIPTRTSSPFQESMMLDAGIHLFGRMSIRGSTVVGPTGQTLYTATVNALAVRGTSNSGTASFNQVSMGENTLRIQVLDDASQPVEGAALLVDAKPVFTGPDGVFEMHERKSRTHSLKILTDQFLDSGEWEVKSAPPAVLSSLRDGDPGALIVVRRVPVARVAPAEKAESSSAEGAREQK